LRRVQGRKLYLKSKRPDLLEEVNGRRSSPPQNCPRGIKYAEFFMA
jgi:hypothetical protein